MSILARSTIITIALVMILTFAFVFIVIQTAEAGYTKKVIKWWYYQCYDIDYNECTPLLIIRNTRKYETRWHKMFGKHPHGRKHIYKKQDDVLQFEVGCSLCDFQAP